MYPLLKRSVGEKIGFDSIRGKLDKDAFEDPNAAIIRGEVFQVAKNQGKSVRELRFNKSTCAELGEQVIMLIKKGQVQLAGELQHEYGIKIEEACVEIYAEMIKYAVRYPDKIGYNKDILEGVTEILSAIQGKPVDIVQLGKHIASPSQKVLARNKSESGFLNTSATDLSEEEQEKARKQQEEFKEQQDAYADFIYQGKIPETLDVSEESRNLVQEFAISCTKVASRYPSLRDTFAQHLDTEFDPEMDIWNIRDIEEAMDSAFIRNLIKSNSLDAAGLEQLKEKTEVLGKFIQSPAF